MPQRHAKNQAIKDHITANEANKHGDAGYGTATKRLGRDSHLPFGYCALSLQPAVDPLVSPSGHVYSREHIYEYLLVESAKLKEKRALWASQCARDDAAAAADADAATNARVAAFTGANDATGAAAGRAADAADAARLAEAAGGVEERDRRAIESHLQLAVVNDGLDSRKKDIPRTAFWCAQFTPSAAPDRAPEPPKRPGSPISGEPLRLKDLLPIELRTQTSRQVADANLADVRFLCHVSQKEITTQPAVMLRNSGCVMLESIAKELAYPTMTCPITSKRFKQRDVLELKTQLSSFAASGDADQIQVKKYRLAIR